MKGRNASRRTARMRCKRDLSGEHFRVVFLHSLHDPGLQVRIAEVSDEECRLLAGRGRLGVADAGMGGIVAHRAWPAGTRYEFHAERKPSRLARREIGGSRLLLRGGPGG